VCFLILRNLNQKDSGKTSNINDSGGNNNNNAKINNKNKIENILGLAKKAGAITAGTEPVIDSVRKKRACHVFVCSDASPATLKKLDDKAAFYHVPVTKLKLTMSELAHCVGLSRLTAAVSLTNKNFLKLLELTEKSTEVHL